MTLRGQQLDHVGIAVRDLAQASEIYRSLGVEVNAEETVEHEQVKTAMLPLGESRVELLQPTAEASVIGRFLASHGEGVHHLAIRVANVDELFERLLSEGVRLASESVQIGVGGHRYFFVHPRSANGVLLEVVGP